MNGLSGQNLLIGVGNEFRNDDALGILVAREIRRRNVPGVTVVERSGEGTALMDAWAGAELVIAEEKSVILQSIERGIAKAGRTHEGELKGLLDGIVHVDAERGHGRQQHEGDEEGAASIARASARDPLHQVQAVAAWPTSKREGR